MKLFEQIEGVVSGVDPKGHGIVPSGGRDIVSFFTVPGDEVRLKLTKRRRGELHGELQKIISPSPARIHPPCPHVGRCGGCLWQMIDYPKQLELKRDLVNQAFAAHNFDFRIKSVEAAKELFYFRNRMDYVFGPNDELGLKEPEKWWSVLNLNTCLLLSEDAVKVMFLVREWTARWELAPWNNRDYRGFLRYLVIREGKNTNERMITIVTGSGELSEAVSKDLVKQLSPFATTIYWGINQKITDLSIAEELHLLHGKPYLTEKINGFAFDIHPNSFFQTNSSMAARLMEVVRVAADISARDRLLDLYCGLGFFSIGLGKMVKEVIGVELDETAVILARENAKANRITNITFHAGPTEKILPSLPKPDVVIVDPPRSGLHRKTLKTLIALVPKRIVYVSCNYLSLARELPEFLRSYRVVSLHGLDLFPHTPRVEVVAVLERI